MLIYWILFVHYFRTISFILYLEEVIENDQQEILNLIAFKKSMAGLWGGRVLTDLATINVKGRLPVSVFRQRMNCAITLKDADVQDVMAELIKFNDFVIYLEKNADNLSRSWIIEVIADIHHGIP